MNKHDGCPKNRKSVFFLPLQNEFLMAQKGGSANTEEGRTHVRASQKRPFLWEQGKGDFKQL